MTEKSVDGDNDDSDSNGDNFDEEITKKTKKKQFQDFSAKIYQFQGLILGKKRANKFGLG